MTNEDKNEVTDPAASASETIEKLHGYEFNEPIKVRKLLDSEATQIEFAPGISELAPLVISSSTGDKVENSTTAEFNRTLTMGKAAFYAYPNPIHIDDDTYGFALWKGIIAGKEGADFIAKSENPNSELLYTSGIESPFPFTVILREDGQILTRFAGAAYYADLLSEARGQKIAEDLGMRCPKLVKVGKFSTEFCENNSLPLPINDNPEDARSENLKAWFEGTLAVEIEQEKLDRILKKLESDAPENSALGESVRLVKNPWRVQDLIQVEKITDEEARKQALSSILNQSLEILKTEDPEITDLSQYVGSFSRILGGEISKLWNGKCLHRGLDQHFQNISLAAEVCDWDTAQTLQDMQEARAGSPGLDLFEKQFKQRLLFEYFYMAGHIKKAVDAVNTISTDHVNIGQVVVSYTEGLVEGLDEETLTGLNTAFESPSILEDLDRQIGSNLQSMQAFNNQQEYFIQCYKELKSRVAAEL